MEESPIFKNLILDNYLKHASLCKDSNCRVKTCKRMKQCFEHVQECPTIRSEFCDTCATFLSDVTHHTKICRVEACPVFLCERLKNIESYMCRLDQECMEDIVEDGPLDDTDETCPDICSPKRDFIYEFWPLIDQKLIAFFIDSDSSRRKAELNASQEAPSTNLDTRQDDPRSSNNLL